MNYFLSCGLARFANLGVFGPSPGNKPKSLSKTHRCSQEGEQKPQNDAPVPPRPPLPLEIRACRDEDGGQELPGQAFPEATCRAGP